MLLAGRNIGPRAVRRLLQSLMLWFWALLAPAVMAETLVVISKDVAVYRDVAHAMERHFSGPLNVVSVAQVRAQPALLAPGRDITVAVGAAASEYLLQQLPLSQRLLATFLPETSWRKMLIRYGARWRPHRDQLSAIYLEQPLQRQLALARLVLPKARTVGTVVGADSAGRLPEIRKAARSYNFELVQTSLHQADNPVKLLQPLIQQSDIFIPLPDQAVFNRTTAKWILYIAYRQRVPLIGFSRKYVEAGAVAAVFSTPEQLGRQSGEFLARYNKADGPLPLSQAPRYFSVITNRIAARSLQLRLPSDDVLTERLREVER